ncbi:MAG: hypothetical protein ACXVAY_17090 [Mucilaginibacter sp.]
MKKREINTKPVVAGLVFAILSLGAMAQKLPNVQQASLRAPADVKIDGKTTEWNNQLQAYNHATDIFYTVSNDDDHLYLTVKATEQAIINKIINGGVTFAINTSGKKNDKGAISITYPIFDRKNRPVFNKTISKSDMEKRLGTSAALTDSAMAARNGLLSEKSKLVAVTGIPSVDTLLSVYNEDGIKTAELFDNQGAYTYELAIDLKKLGLDINNPAKFAYHITLNGSPLLNFKTTSDGGGSAAVYSVSAAPVGSALLDAKISLDLMQSSSSPTDFWGEYILAKK